MSYLTTDQAGQGSKRLVVASEGGVMAAVNSRTGNISELRERAGFRAVSLNKSTWCLWCRIYNGMVYFNITTQS